MKVELENLTIGVSPLTGEVFVGTTEKGKPGVWKHKKEITNAFTFCIIEKFGPNHATKVTDQDGNHTHNIIIVPADKKIEIDGKEF